MKHFYKRLLQGICLCCLLVSGLSMSVAHAAMNDRQPLSQDYIEKYFTSVAAASCLGIYLPQSSNEFNYLRNTGWMISPRKYTQDHTETNFAIAMKQFPKINRTIYMVTFRGSASKADWGINLKTNKVNFGGSTIAEMESIAAAPIQELTPSVHAGFNKYVNTVMHGSVVDENGSLKGVFKAAFEDKNATLVLTGHSLGGAAATILGARLSDMGMPKDRMVVVTFGAPAIGNEEMAQVYGDKINLLRITNTADPVPGSLQTFFSKYKQFGKHIKYSISPKISSMQHAMAYYFDYSVSEYYHELDNQIALGRMHGLPDKVETAGMPKVAIWLQASDNLKRVASITDIRRFALDEIKLMLPSYEVMDTSVKLNAYEHANLVQISKEHGADYVLILGIDGKRPQHADYWYLNMEQVLFDGEGHLMTMGSYAKKVAPSAGNIQALGENLLVARTELKDKLPFIRLNYDVRFGE